jgi:soluble P-type ATPase
MSRDLAVIMDVAGTILRMYRVAKDISRGDIIEKVVTWELIMKKKGQALVVPQIDPEFVIVCRPDDPLSTLFCGREECVEISCSSSPIIRDDILDILCRSQIKIQELQEICQVVKAKCPYKYRTLGMIVDEDIGEITYVLSTGGTPFPGLQGVLIDLENLGADVFIASGDSMRSLMNLKDYGIDLKRVYPVASPRRKQEIVADLKKEYRRVVMVGDGLNDLYALLEADLGVLTVQQDTHPALKLCQAADRIIMDIQELPKILMMRT